MSELPKGWSSIRLDEIANYNPKHSKDISDATPVSFVPMTVITENSANIGQHDQRPLGQVRKGYTHFADGDVIIAKITPCFENGKGAIASNLISGIGCGTTELHVLRPSGAILKEYLYHYLHREQFRKEAKTQMTGTAGQLRVPSDYLKNVEIPLAPLNEQKRIVAKLDELLPKVEACKERLQKIPAILKRFRQSVLAAAVSGKLTEEWRKENKQEKAQIPVGSPNKKRRKLKGNDVYFTIENFEETILFDLPSAWSWAKLSDFEGDEQLITTGPFGTSLKSKDFIESGVPLLTIGCLTEHGIDSEAVLFVSEKKALELQRYRLRKDDLLFSRMATVGRAGKVDAAYDGALYNYHLMRLRLPKEINVDYFLLVVKGAPSTKRYLREINHGVTRDGINTGELMDLPIPLPPEDEQRKIVDQVKVLFAELENMENRLFRSSKVAERTEQAILAQAFSGSLVSQDPTDEPASAMAERSGGVGVYTPS